MYFEHVDVFKIEDHVSNLENMYAHRDTENKNPKEHLKCHIERTIEYFYFICREKNLDNIFINLEKSLLKGKDIVLVKLWKEMLINTVYMHDVGKINPAFQYDIMLNDFYKDNESRDSKHSLLSSYIYVSYFNKKIKNLDIEKLDKSFLRYFMYLNAYIISKHHGYLSDFEGFGTYLSDETEDYFKEDDFPDLNMDTLKSSIIANFFYPDKIKDIKEYVENEDNNFSIYIYTKILFSILTASDYYATAEYMDGHKVVDMGTITKELKERFCSEFNNYEITKSIRNYEKNPVIDGNYTSINELRSEITLESEKNYLKNKDKNIYYLEAPTGAGKTITSINLANLILKSEENINKLFYVFPFNTLVEQTEKGLKDIFKSDITQNISVINSLTPIKTVDENEDYKDFRSKENNRKIDYKKSLLNRIFLNYPFIITTHVNLFNYLFGTSREEGFPLIHICNSIVIIDEIQSYKNGIWKEIINFLNAYAEILNIKVIIMSATLPRLNKLVEGEDNNFVYLIEDRKHYFGNPLFKNRVQFEMLNLGEDPESEGFELLLKDILMESKSNNKILIEFIFKKHADKFFDYMNENFISDSGYEIKVITSDDNKIDREKIIKLAKGKKNRVIIISTQVIEAGVDIDMDLGYKNISILDAEEQFMGRINRSCLNSGRVKFFQIDNCRLLYKDDVRKEKELTLINPEIHGILRNKDFEGYYDRVINKIEKKKTEINDKGYLSFIKQLYNLNFEKIKDYMKLIDDEMNQNKYTIFLSRKIEIKDEKSGNTDILDGSILWKDYKKLLMDSKMDYSERRVKLSEKNAQLSYFIYKVKKLPSQYNEILGDIYYIEDGEKYVVNGRFNQEIFMGETSDEANLIL
ncbi:CRISPR-associated helicase/endonuclease Cas3 [Clostridium scatologenes]|uniref:CRISPR-associated helicase Cas3 n=1 Tax=Clostridium scatologenes TaxID=1548 RepID=A0A0E3JMC0_CLOSL|nr:CRISPR-associated helicase/endonuclease Cas3 [Clostridium scatologenes]AKA67873.1 CRISPR-associated helicase Cas3 [Clostridium scatologenes]